MPLLRSWEKSIATECYKDVAPGGATAGGCSASPHGFKVSKTGGQTRSSSRFLDLGFLLRL